MDKYFLSVLMGDQTGHAEIYDIEIDGDILNGEEVLPLMKMAYEDLLSAIRYSYGNFQPSSVTFMFSSHRQIRLLSKNSTDVKS